MAFARLRLAARNLRSLREACVVAGDPLDELVDQPVAVLGGDLLAQDPRGQLDRELRRLLAQVRARAAQLVFDGGGGVRADALGRGARVGEQARAFGLGALLRSGADLGELALE